MPISTVVIKTIRACNLRCPYCYYINADTTAYGLTIGHECIEAFYEKFSQYGSGSGGIDFIWHGGEPLLLGKQRFTAYLELQRDFFSPGQVRNSIQTNGTLLDSDWLDLFQRYDVSIGVSLDGPQAVHDLNRPTVAGQGSFAQVMRGIQLLKQREVPVHVLHCIGPDLEGAEAVAFMEGLEVDGCDFLLPMSNHPLSRRRVLEIRARAGSSGTEEDYVGEFLASAFSRWVRTDCSLRVRLFEDLIRCALGVGNGFPYSGPSEEVLADFVLLETDGSLCMDVEFGEIDRYRLGKEYRTGLNILHEGTTLEMVEAEIRRRVRSKSLAKLPDECQPCLVRSVCRASHPASRYDDFDGSFNHRSVHCSPMYRLCKLVVEFIQGEGLTSELVDKRLREEVLASAES